MSSTMTAGCGVCGGTMSGGGGRRRRRPRNKYTIYKKRVRRSSTSTRKKRIGYRKKRGGCGCNDDTHSMGGFVYKKGGGPMSFLDRGIFPRPLV